MKRSGIILFCALAVLMAGCVRIVETKSPVAEEDAWMYDETLPVPVRLGVSGTDTKASINSISDIKGKTFGVFAFDNAATDLRADDGMMMRNVPALGLVKDNIGSLGLSEVFYYPISSESEFSLYSYYAYPMTSVLSEVTRTQALVTIPVTTVNDVLWAKSHVAGGYNAHYIRQGGAAPSFNYSHATACLSFKACIDEAIDGTQVKLASLALIAPATATLCVADIENPENEGTFVRTGNNVERYALTSGYSGGLDLVLTETPQLFCQDMFIVPGGTSLTLKAYFVIRSAGADGVSGTADDVIQNMTGTVVLRPGDSGEVFKAGYRYAFNLRMLSPSELVFEFADEDEGQISVEGYRPAFQ